MNICVPRVTSLLRALIAGVGLFLTSAPARADFIINTGTSVNFGDQPFQGINDGGNLSIQNGGLSPTNVTFVCLGYVGGDLSINGTSVVNFPSSLANNNDFYLSVGGIVGGNVYSYDSSTVNFAGGITGENFYAYNSSTVNISQNASVGGNFAGSGSSTTNMSGGLVNGNVYLQDNSVLNLSGGTVDANVSLQDSSVLNLSGGSIGGYITLQDNSSLNVFGSVTVTGSSGDYTLLGTLADGTDLGSGLEIFTGSGGGINVNPAPAPSGIVLLLVGSCSLLGWRAASRRVGSNIRRQDGVPAAPLH